MPTNYFTHPNALVEAGAKVGENTRIWAFAHILSGAEIGRDCNICDGVFIENNVIIGDRVTIKCGVQLWDGIRIEEDVFIGPNATFTNDPFPRSKQHLSEYPLINIRNGASVGANATILPGIEVGKNAMVGAGAVVTRNVPQNAIVKGNPARITGYSNLHRQKPVEKRKTESPSFFSDILVPEVSLIKLSGESDLRGELTYGEYGTDIPFVPKRFFLVYDVPTKEVRGEHAHRDTHQFLVCVKGSVNVSFDNGVIQDEIILNDPHVGLHIPPMIWAVQYLYSPEAILLVLASDNYDARDYIRNYDDYLEEINLYRKKDSIS